MNKFLFKSSNPDLQKIFFLLESKLEIMNKNLLYQTHQSDKCLSILRRMELDNKLQTQVDDFNGPGEARPGLDSNLEDMAQDGNSSGN